MFGKTTALRKGRARKGTKNSVALRITFQTTQNVLTQLRGPALNLPPQAWVPGDARASTGQGGDQWGQTGEVPGAWRGQGWFPGHHVLPGRLLPTGKGGDPRDHGHGGTAQGSEVPGEIRVLECQIPLDFLLYLGIKNGFLWDLISNFFLNL